MGEILVTPPRAANGPERAAQSERCMAHSAGRAVDPRAGDRDAKRVLWYHDLECPHRMSATAVLEERVRGVVTAAVERSMGRFG
jgi:hypothetical protein